MDDDGTVSSDVDIHTINDYFTDKLNSEIENLGCNSNNVKKRVESLIASRDIRPDDMSFSLAVRDSTTNIDSMNVVSLSIARSLSTGILSGFILKDAYQVDKGYVSVRDQKKQRNNTKLATSVFYIGRKKHFTLGGRNILIRK